MYSGEGREFFEAGNQFYQTGDMQEAIHYYRMALTSFQDYGDIKGAADTLLEMGNTYFQLGNYFQSNRNYQKALEFILKWRTLLVRVMP